MQTIAAGKLTTQSGKRSYITEEASCKSKGGEDHRYNRKPLHDDVHDVSLQGVVGECVVRRSETQHLFCHAEIYHGETAVL
jgi:hypothetical protein